MGRSTSGPARLNPLYISVLLVVIALWVNFWQRVVSIESIGLAALFSSVIVVLAFVVTALVLTQMLAPALEDLRAQTDRHAEQLRGAIQSMNDSGARLERLLELVRGDYRGIAGIVKDVELAAYERAAVGEVWIATRDMLYDLETFFPIVTDNIRRQVRYRYLLPSGESEVLSRFREVKRMVSSLLGEIWDAESMMARCCSDRFPFIYECGVYSPSATGRCQGFIVMPALRSEFNFLLSPEMTLRLVDLFKAHWTHGTSVD